MLRLTSSQCLDEQEAPRFGWSRFNKNSDLARLCEPPKYPILIAHSPSVARLRSLLWIFNESYRIRARQNGLLLKKPLSPLPKDSSSQPHFLLHRVIHVLQKLPSLLHNPPLNQSHRDQTMLLTLSQTSRHARTLRNNPLSSPLRGHRLVHSISCLTWYSMFCEKLPVFFSTSSCTLGSVSSNPRTSIGIRWLLR
jgi:hypothetical protein